MCGLFGYSSDDPSKFSKDKFNILGVLNDDRGGDACGIYYDNILHKSVLPPKFNKFTIDHTPNKIEIPYIIGHTRKASFGTKRAVEQAQPIVLIDKNKNDCICVAHNGTIYNDTELAEKYKVFSDVDDTDTQILTNIIDKDGFENVLEDYAGTAALIIYKPLEDLMHVYHGKSKQYQNGAATEERPLYWLQEDGSIYISSIEHSLNIIANDVENVSEVPFNTVFTIQRGQIIDEITIDRSKASQSKTLFNQFNKNFNYNDRINIRKHCDVKIPPINKVYFEKGNYYCNQVLVDGKYNLTPYSFLNGQLEIEFYDGILIYPGTYNILDKKFKDCKSCSTSTEYYNIIKEFVPFPFSIPTHNKHNTSAMLGDFRPGSLNNSDGNAAVWFGGKYIPVFHNYEYTFRTGDLYSVESKNVSLLTEDIYKQLKRQSVKLIKKYTKTDEDTVDIVDNKNVNLSNFNNALPAARKGNVVCPECLGYSIQIDEEDCDVCNNMGEISEQVYNSYKALLVEDLDQTIEELELTDISLENTLFLNNIQHKIKNLDSYLSDVSDSILNFIDCGVYDKSSDIRSNTILNTYEKIESTIKQLKEFNKQVNYVD